MRQTPVRLALLFVMIASLAGCSTVERVRQSVGDVAAGLADERNRIGSISLGTEPDANQTTATLLDIVFVYDNVSAAWLPADAQAWFENREALRIGRSREFDIVTLDLPPGYALNDVPLPERHADAHRVYIYARYLAPAGQARIDISSFRRPRITLRINDIAVREQAPR